MIHQNDGLDEQITIMNAFLVLRSFWALLVDFLVRAGGAIRPYMYLIVKNTSRIDLSAE